MINVGQLVNHAKVAQVSWAQMDILNRVELVKKGVEVATKRCDEIAEVINEEMGKPIHLARSEILSVKKNFQAKASCIVDALISEKISDNNCVTEVFFEPLGVVGCITPWNFPFSIPFNAIIHGLITGNSVILKPSEIVVGCGKWLIDCLSDLPEGVLTMLSGGSDIGKELVNSNIDLVFFTGSSQIGSVIIEQCSKTRKRIICEMGGQNVMLVLNDAVQEDAVEFLLKSAFDNSGQSCIATKRVIIEESIYNNFMFILIRRIKEYNLNKHKFMGPLGNLLKLNRYNEWIKMMIDKGAELVYGEYPMDAVDIGPIVLSNPKNINDYCEKDLFFPIVILEKARTRSEMVMRGNRTVFGLGAVIFSQSIEEAVAVGKRLKVGMLGINMSCKGIYSTPWVGTSKSGVGFWGFRDGARQFCQTRKITTSL